MKNRLRILGAVILIFLIQYCRKEIPKPPGITTKEVTEISCTTANSGGELINNGGGKIISQGICWSTETNPTINNNEILDSTGVDTFICKIAGLIADTTYYVRAFATNQSGIGYGNVMSFVTRPCKGPKVFTLPPTNITMTSATLNGIVYPNKSSTKLIFYFGQINQLHPANPLGGIVTPVPDTYSGNIAQYVSVNVEIHPVRYVSYGFQAFAQNEFGTSVGNEYLFGGLIVETRNASILTASNVTLYGFIDPDYVPTTVSFLYGPTASYGNIITATESPVTINQSVTANLIGLTQGITYHYKVQAENLFGTSQVGSDKTFEIPDETTATTHAATNLMDVSATLNGIVFPNFLPTIVTFEYGTSTNYESTISAIPNGLTGGNIVNVSANISGLISNTKYHFRIKAVNETGTKYGDDFTFNTMGQFGAVTDFENNTYKTIEIGNQVWMAENLKTTKYSDGTPISLIVTNDAWSALPPESKAYCWYNDDANNKTTYGALYTWAAAMNGAVSSISNPSGVQGVCPTGWHLPSDVEWTELVTYLGGNGTAYKLIEKGTTHWHSNIKATNESGFTALPGGIRGGLSYDITICGNWWTSTENSNINALHRRVCGNSDNLMTSFVGKNVGMSVRCIQD